MSVVTLLGLVLDVRDINGNTAFLLFWSLIDLAEIIFLVQIRVLVVQNLGDCCSQGSLTVINVADGADVDMRLSAYVLGLLCHYVLLDVRSSLPPHEQKPRYILQNC